MKLKRDAGSLFQPLPNPRIELTSAELATLAGLIKKLKIERDSNG